MEHDSSIMNEGRTSEIREEKQKENKIDSRKLLKHHNRG